MEKTILTPEMTEVLTKSHFAYLCTTDRENQPHITPMFYIFDQETSDIFITAASNSKKMSNIRTNPKISLTIDIRDPVNPFKNHGVMVQGKAVVVKTEEGKLVFNVGMYMVGNPLVEKTQEAESYKLAQASKAFAEKYPVLQGSQSPVLAEARSLPENLIKIVPKRIVYWKGPNFKTVNF